MDVIFEVSSSKGKRCFTIEVGFFDTVLEIKQKIQKYEGIPVSRQTLIFNAQIMIYERDTEFYEVLNWSHIQLQIEPPPTSTPTPTPTPTPVQEQQQQQPQPSGGGGGGGGGVGVGVGVGVGGGGKAGGGLLKINEETSSSSSTCVSKTKIQLLIKIPASKRQFSLGGIDLNHDTVLRLKEKIHEGEGIPINRFVLFFSGNELMENRTLLDYGIGDLSEINVVIKTFPSSTTTSSGGGGGGGGPMTPPPPSGGGGGGGSNKRLKLMVLPAKSGAQKIQVEMNSMDNVGELRKELQRLQQQQPGLAVHLPAEGYFFIYKQTVMEEDRSFRWHDIRQGDTIEIFNGSVTGGS